jgi:Cilia- and flagella-associated protein 54
MKKSYTDFQAFARRAIAKINDLSELMKVSSIPASKDTEVAFRGATVKASAL